MILPSKIQHVYPVNDSEEHVLFVNIRPSPQLPVCYCTCKPEHQELEPDENGEPTAMIVIHNSFDGREGVEWTNEIINQ